MLQSWFLMRYYLSKLGLFVYADDFISVLFYIGCCGSRPTYRWFTGYECFGYREWTFGSGCFDASNEGKNHPSDCTQAEHGSECWSDRSVLRWEDLRTRDTLTAVRTEGSVCFSRRLPKTRIWVKNHYFLIAFRNLLCCQSRCKLSWCYDHVFCYVFGFKHRSFFITGKSFCTVQQMLWILAASKATALTSWKGETQPYR